MSHTPLSVLDLVPVSSGASGADALRNAVALAQATESFGYHRYWVAEHHLNPGVAGTSPAVVLALLGSATSTIRIGSGAVLMGHRTALSTIEEFGLLDAAFPGRIDLGLGRSGGRPGSSGPVDIGVNLVDGRTPEGLLVPPKFDPSGLLGSPRFRLQKELLQLPGATSADYGEQVDTILAFIDGTYRDAAGTPAQAVPGEGAELELWVLGSSGGESAEVAGKRGLRFATNYHVNPSGVLEAAYSYRTAFAPSDTLAAPHVAVSADVVVAETEEEARELATGYGLWVRSIRTAEGAIPFPTPDEARAWEWTEEDRALVQDRLDTQFVGTAAQVADQLEILQRAVDADELVITTITHDHADRVRSYQLIAEEWARRGH
ncbi:LLM class flavin-dependent oxidoreductase [Nocardioides luteus]|uniref:LLM class flavin-dependent oxidoreductase n=1 Tax=Nocardioides luteus TaxID=1844 RepID=UPI0018C9E39E|nr:LLM class flavin-dependent oxidoreductase [Nocardioides luteus]MBG6098517.1 alkanesulfonate monooxygenase SsuD/methylene tetrahydromethanopterin reductase-like flavin-dependent oxidoreductase (luciferase family) [Nocardioides luteus]